ncbi:MAG: hypothetical protein OQK12_09875 [Motiliproteus sp.]|nr:hypothetical protein [Motiliproteus sp.]MCW9051267.1 hypothetical protein [Motiliproteus sp.]
MYRAKLGRQSQDNWPEHTPLCGLDAAKAFNEKLRDERNHARWKCGQLKEEVELLERCRKDLHGTTRQLQGEVSELRKENVDLKQQVRNQADRIKQLEQEAKQWQEA